ncbi:unnamed protein product, partial [Meganyctiphanes norvegica]
RRADVITRGFSGYNTRMCKELLPYVASDMKDVVAATVFLGANDATDGKLNTQQSVPIDEYRENLKSIIKHFKSHGIETIVIAPPAVDGPSWAKYCADNGKVYTLDEERTEHYAAACRETAQEMETPFIDLHTVMINQSEWRSFLCDGLHLSRLGSELLASLLIPVLEKSIVNRISQNLLVPLWSEVNNQNPSKTFQEWCQKNIK